MAENDLIAAHKHCSNHRDEIEASEICGCFFCLEIYQPSEITRWIDGPNLPDLTAVCPECGIDSVIGSASRYPISMDFLRKMKRHWFGV